MKHYFLSSILLVFLVCFGSSSSNAYTSININISPYPYVSVGYFPYTPIWPSYYYGYFPRYHEVKVVPAYYQQTFKPQLSEEVEQKKLAWLDAQNPKVEPEMTQENVIETNPLRQQELFFHDLKIEREQELEKMLRNQ